MTSRCQTVKEATNISMKISQINRYYLDQSSGRLQFFIVNKNKIQIYKGWRNPNMENIISHGIHIRSRLIFRSFVLHTLPYQIQPPLYPYLVTQQSFPPRHYFRFPSTLPILLLIPGIIFFLFLILNSLIFKQQYI